MKKTFRIIGLALVATALCLTGCSKDEEEEEEEGDAVSISAPTQVQNRNALVEEFTGVGCQFCPDGHDRVSALMRDNPGRAFGINVHTGMYASRYTTEFGTALDDQADVGGYPAGTVNRHVFQGLSQRSGTAMSRGGFVNAASQIMAQTSCANIAAKATINQSSRQLTVEVAVYYTSESAQSTNYINVALLQDSIWGPQSINQNLDPEQYDPVTGKYCHQHMLRHLVTGQWGDAISVSTGKQITKKYTYTIPEKISDEDVILKHLDVIVFLAEGHQEVITACKAKITLQ